MAAAKSEVQTHVDPLLLEVADVVNTTLDLDTTLRRVAELVRKVIDYEIFGILLLNEKTQELYFRFSVGHQRDIAERLRIKLGLVLSIVPMRYSLLNIAAVSSSANYVARGHRR